MLETRSLLTTFSFTPSGSYEGGSASWDATAGDFNGDGTPDLAVANFGQPDSTEVSLLIGNGDGTFAPKVRLRAGDKPCAIESADLNADGHLDLAVANIGSGDVSILLNVGDGTFSEATSYAIGTLPCGVAAEDLNGDGHLDLAVGTYREKFSTLLNDGDGTFGARRDYRVGIDPRLVVPRDFDRDGDHDLAILDHMALEVFLYLNQGDGTFADDSGAYSVASGYAESFAAGDIDGDGVLDLAVVWGEGANGTVEVLRGRPDGTFAEPDDYDAGNEPGSVVLEDFNGDGRLDLAVSNKDSHSVTVLVGNGDGTFGDPEIFPTDTNGPCCLLTLVAEDLNLDGRIDLAVTYAEFGVSVLLNNTEIQAPRPLTGDANQDGFFNQLDIVMVLQAGKYLIREPATFAEGDWNNDGVFDQLDIVAALAAGSYSPDANTAAAMASSCLARLHS